MEATDGTGGIDATKEFTRTGRAGLIVLAALGLNGVNGVSSTAPSSSRAHEAATFNPEAVAFTIEAANFSGIGTPERR